MEIVTFETAKKLKEAGFQQPTNDLFYKTWYVDREFILTDGSTGKNWVLCVSMLGYMAMPYLVPLSFRDEHFLPEYDKMVFAPTATDIMRQIHGLPLVYDGPNFGISGDWYSNLNPAELMAERYLAQ